MHLPGITPASLMVTALLAAGALTLSAQAPASPAAGTTPVQSIANVQQVVPVGPAAPITQQGSPAPASAAASTSAQTAYPLADNPVSDPRRRPTSRPGAFTLQQVVQIARDHNPTLFAAAESLRGVRAQEVQAAVRANPYIGVAASNVSLPAQGASNPYQYAVQVSRLFERGQKRRYRIEDANATTTQTAQQLEDTSRQTVLLVKQAFSKMLIAKSALELANGNLKDYRHEIDVASERYKAGDIGLLDFKRLDLQLGGFESDQANAEINLLQASDQLQTLMGVPTPVADFDIMGDIVPPVVTISEAEFTRLALLGRPDYLAAHTGVLVAEAAAKLAIANGTADPTLEGEYDRSGTYNSAGFNVNLPLRLFDRNQGNKETAQYQISSARLSETASRNQVVSDVDQAYVGYTHCQALSERFGSHYLDESTDVLSIARFAYEHGGLALIDYLDALRDSRSSASDALNAYLQTWMALHQLSAASAVEVAP